MGRIGRPSSTRAPPGPGSNSAPSADPFLCTRRPTPSSPRAGQPLLPCASAPSFLHPTIIRAPPVPVSGQQTLYRRLTGGTGRSRAAAPPPCVELVRVIFSMWIASSDLKFSVFLIQIPCWFFTWCCPNPDHVAILFLFIICSTVRS
jgi:hypothetical protein